MTTTRTMRPAGGESTSPIQWAPANRASAANVARRTAATRSALALERLPSGAREHAAGRAPIALTPRSPCALARPGSRCSPPPRTAARALGTTAGETKMRAPAGMRSSARGAPGSACAGHPDHRAAARAERRRRRRPGPPRPAPAGRARWPTRPGRARPRSGAARRAAGSRSRRSAPRWTHSEAAARTAMSSASSLSAPDGSSTIRGAESSSATRRRSSISPPPRDRRPMDARRRGALAVGPQAVDLELGQRGVQAAPHHAGVDAAAAAGARAAPRRRPAS